LSLPILTGLIGDGITEHFKYKAFFVAMKSTGIGRWGLFFVVLLMGLYSCGSRGKSIDSFPVPVLSDAEMRKLKLHLNAEHIEEARRSSLKKPIESQKWFRENQDDVVDDADLVEIKDGKYYIISSLSHSLPFLTEETADFLELLGKRMEKVYEENDLKKYRFSITSVLRTVDDQRKLRKVNLNATMNETSHYYGVSVDISQTRFVEQKSREPIYTYLLRNLLARELIRLQDEGKCFVLLESREKCFHITVVQ
jgi:hypothetical protein